jgi:iron complex transport system permease protein
METKRVNPATALSVSVVVTLAALAIAILAGSGHLDFSRAVHGLAPDRQILLQLRAPRALLALWTGGALGLSGVLFQAMLRNPLAEPYTLGVSGGASLGAVTAIFFRWDVIAGLPAVSFVACAGAALVLLLIVGISSDRGQMSSTSLLLAGVTLNSICTAAILFLSSLSDVLQSFSVNRWLMGGMQAPSYTALFFLSVLLTPVCVTVFWHGREWNLLAMGETWASTRGLSPSRLLLIGCAAASILTGTVTVLTGPIGFVGLIIPHALRMWLGADHRVLAPCSFLVGAAFVALCDVFSRTVLAPVEIPVGVITALLGGPVFIWMLRDRRKGLIA